MGCWPDAVAPFAEGTAPQQTTTQRVLTSLLNVGKWVESGVMPSMPGVFNQNTLLGWTAWTALNVSLYALKLALAFLVYAYNAYYISKNEDNVLDHRIKPDAYAVIIITWLTSAIIFPLGLHLLKLNISSIANKLSEALGIVITEEQVTAALVYGRKAQFSLNAHHEESSNFTIVETSADQHQNTAEATISAASLAASNSQSQLLPQQVSQEGNSRSLDRTPNLNALTSTLAAARTYILPLSEIQQRIFEKLPRQVQAKLAGSSSAWRRFVNFIVNIELIQLLFAYAFINHNAFNYASDAKNITLNPFKYNGAVVNLIIFYSLATYYFADVILRTGSALLTPRPNLQRILGDNGLFVYGPTCHNEVDAQLALQAIQGRALIPSSTSTA